MTNPQAIAEGLALDQREFILGGSWQGVSFYDPRIHVLNAAELLHLDVLKASNGNIRRWKARLTPLGVEVRKILQQQERPNDPR